MDPCATGIEMQCKDYQKALAADPSESFDGASHAAACKSCMAFKAEIQALDARIATALAIEVPALSMRSKSSPREAFRQFSEKVEISPLTCLNLVSKVLGAWLVAGFCLPHCCANGFQK